MTRVIPLLLLLPLLLSCGQKFQRPSFLLIAVDTLRADALGCHGSPDGRTPALDALARRGLQFRACVSQAPWTLPAAATILTGRFPSAHGANGLQRRVAPGAPLLAENLRSSSYRTAAFVANQFLQEKYGLHRGFDHFDDSFVGDEKTISSEAVTRAAVRWIRSDTRPFFALLFYMDPHYAYMEHEGFTGPRGHDGTVRPGEDIWSLRERAGALDGADVEQLRRLYAGEVRALDHAVGRLMNALDEDGATDNAFVLLTADHGEELLERGWIGHTRHLHSELLDVPFLLSAPKWIRPALRTDPAMLIDVFPTALQCLGLAPTRVPGRAVLAEDRSERPLYSEVTYDPQVIPPQPDPERSRSRSRELTKIANMRSLRRGDWKVIRNRLTDSWELYDLAADPGETRDVAVDHPGTLAELRKALPEPGVFDITGPAAVAGMSDEEVERLRALGYVR